MPASFTCKVVRIAALSLIFATAGGCWEEIRYTPRAETAPGTSGNASPSTPAASNPPVGVGATPMPGSSEPFGGDPAPGSTSPKSQEEPTTAASNSIPTSPVADPPAAAVGVVLAGAKSPTPNDRLRVWEAAGKWSLAAAIYAKGLEASRYEPTLADASAAAKFIGVELPPLPAATSDAPREATVVEVLRGETAKKLATAVGQHFTPAESAEAELAIGCHALLLTYSPGGEDVASQIRALRENAEASGLPVELYTPLLKLLDEQATFLAVRQAIFDLDRSVAKHLSGK